MKKLYLLLFISWISFQSNAQILAWDFDGNTGSETAVRATKIDPNISASRITRGWVSPADMENSFSATNWTQTNSLTDAIANNSYFQFTLQAKSGFSLSFSELNANFLRSATGPTEFQWRYSLDGVNFTNLGNQISYTGTETDGAAQPTMNLVTEADLQDINSSIAVTIRLYGFNAADAAGNFSLGRLNENDLNISGKVDPTGLLSTKLLNFSVVNSNNIARLHWMVECTTSSITFEIQRAQANQEFSTIYTRIEQQARCSQPFEIKDENTLEGIVYYRLKMINPDGRSSYSNILQVINKNPGNTEIRVFPSVVQQQATLCLSADKEGDASVFFIDMQGRQLRSSGIHLYKGTNNISLNTSDLPVGKYYITVITNDGKYKVAPLLKQ